MALGALVAGCAVDARNPSAGLGDVEGACLPGARCDAGAVQTGDGDASPPSAVNAFGLGDACGSPTECASGFCVDGVCCDSACDGVCSECSAAGRCDVMPETACDGDDERPEPCDGGTCGALPPGCGDGIEASSEVCDDGNTSNTDSCTNACQLPSCGDGFVQPGRGETCDDGGRVDGDGCSVACLFGSAPSGGIVGTHQCMLRSDGATVCWGNNGQGQLGQGSSGTGSLGPVVVPNVSNVQQLAVSSLGTCGVLRSGNVVCWGGNFGAGAASVSGLDDVRQLTSSAQAFCALLGSGTVTCFDDVGVITPVVGLDAVRRVVGGFNHICAVRTDDSLWCWGANDIAQLGTGATGDATVTPGQATMFSNVAEVALGLQHTCVRSRAGGVSCVGRLPGLGLFTNLTPVTVPNWETATKIVAGSGHLCALLSNDVVQCKGPAPAGGVDPGNGNPATIFLPPGKIDIGAYGNGACVLLGDSSVHCWGANGSGELGSPGPESTDPVQVPVPAP